MAFVDENDPNYNFKGWRKYYNSYTLRGRFNFVVTTYACVAGIVALVMYRRRGKDAIDEAPPSKKH